MFELPPFEIIRASRRSIALQISKWVLVVRAPFSVPEDIVHAFIDRKADWIRKHMEKHAEHIRTKELWYLGKSYCFEYHPHQKEALVRSEWVFAFSEKVRVALMEPTVLRNWYWKEAQTYLSERVAYFAQKYNLQYGRVRITSATTRWGSCSGRDNIAFPWRLHMAPPEVIDYVVVHELAHTVHKNHSPRFWALVASMDPDWKTHRAHLKEEGWKYSLPVF